MKRYVVAVLDYETGEVIENNYVFWGHNSEMQIKKSFECAANHFLMTLGNINYREKAEQEPRRTKRCLVYCGPMCNCGLRKQNFHELK